MSGQRANQAREILERNGAIRVEALPDEPAGQAGQAAGEGDSAPKTYNICGEDKSSGH
jgi:hypothetical protein